MLSENKSELYSSLRPMIIDYNDYRLFLKDFYLFKKSQSIGFSFRKFSALVGISSPNYFLLVIKGERNLSLQLADKVGKALNLSAPEHEYFLCMVELSQTEAEDLDKIRRKQLVAMRKLITRHIPQSKVRILNEWYHLVIREMVQLADFSPDGQWIAMRLRGLITAEQAEESLALMLKTGFLKYENQKFQLAEPEIEINETIGESCLLNIHKSTLVQWRNIIEDTTDDQRELGLLNIAINSNRIPELKKKIQDFQDEIIRWSQSAKGNQQIVQFASYLIPITDSSDKI